MQNWPALMANLHQCTNPHCPHRPGGTRDRLLTTLREASLPDLDNERNRFIPRDDLIRIVDVQAVSQMLQFSEPTLEEATTQETVNRICSEHGQCGCGRNWCTGARLLFAALALIAAERRIVEFFDTYKRSDQLCDSNPHLGSLADPSNLKQVLTGWSEEKKELFIQLQWQMRSPYFRYLLEDNPPGLDRRVSLPWVQRGDHGEERSGQFSKVWKIKIHPHHHDMVGHLFSIVPSPPGIYSSQLHQHSNSNVIYRRRTTAISHSKHSRKLRSDPTTGPSRHFTTNLTQTAESLFLTPTSHPY